MADPDYRLLDSQLRALIADESDPLASACNFVALLYDAMSDVNWLGIYVSRDTELVLGPFQGKPACVHLKIGSGVCGTAALSMETQRVADVHQFEGHVACDAGSRSEVVVPLVCNGVLIGVLDIDSPKVDRFSELDQQGIERLCATFCEFQSLRERFI
jgi:L-methionine (R)-S-oxide reductase